MEAEWPAGRTVQGYLDEVAAATPTPGGGSVAAVVGALSAALGEMVVNLTLGHGKDADTEQALVKIGEHLMLLRKTLLAEAAADEAAYASYLTAAHLPRDSESERASRTAEMEAALLTATEAPLRVARAAAETAGILETVARDGNPRLRSDSALAALLAETALRGALLNVRGNAALLRDDEHGRVYLADADRLEERGREAARRALQTVMERTG